MYDSLYSALTTTGASTLATLVTCWLWLRVQRREEEERRKTEAQLASLQERRLEKIERAIEEHLSIDNPREVQNEFIRLRGEMTRISDQLSRSIELQRAESGKINNALGEIVGALGGIKIWMQNTNDSVQKHVTNLEIHHHGK